MLRAAIPVAGLIGSLVAVSLLACVILIRWPFAAISWVLKGIGNALADLTYYLENL